MSNVMKIVIIFAALLVIIGGIFVVAANWSGHEDLLPPAFQDPQQSEQTVNK